MLASQHWGVQARIRTKRIKFLSVGPRPHRSCPGLFTIAGTGSGRWLARGSYYSSSRAINHEIEAGWVGAWPLSAALSVPVLQTLCCYDALRTSHAQRPLAGCVGLKCRVEACSTLVPADEVHGQPLTDCLPVSKIPGSKVSGRARRKLTKRRKFPRLGPRRERTASPGSGATRAQYPSGLRRGAELHGSAPSIVPLCGVCALGVP